MENNMTERLYDAMEPFSKTFNIPYCDEDFYQALAAFADSDRSNESKCRDDLKKMLRSCGYTGDLPAGKSYVSYRELVLDLIRKKDIKTSDQISQQVRGICEMLFKEYKDFPTPAAYMQRLVDRLCNPDDPWQNDTLRLRILKQFIKYGGCLTPIKGCNQKALCAYVAQQKGVESITGKELLAALNDGSLTDDVFSLLRTASDDDIKEKYRLLVMADRLASGNFVRSGGTKQDLYLFAICFHMNYAAHPGSSIARDTHDIEHHLFTDYYAANVLIYISDAYRQDPDNTVVDPIGTTINFKNYAEMVYLYYICKPMDPAQKVKSAVAMIRTLQRAAKELPADRKTSDELPGATIKLKNRFLANPVDGPLSLPEDQFVQFLLANYNCSAVHGSPFIVNSGANTAKEKYIAIVQRLQAKAADLAGNYKGIPELEDAVYRYGLFFDEAYSQSIGSEPAPDDNRRDFLTILHQVNKKLLKDESLIKNCNPDTVDAEQITRTKLLAALYYDFNDKHAGTKGIRYGFSFQQHFHQFTEEIDKVLVECNFTPFNHKNLLDMLLLYSSYVCINE